MASVDVLNVLVLDPIAKFSDPFKFEITFECLSELKNEGIEHFLTKKFRHRLENNICRKR